MIARLVLASILTLGASSYRATSILPPIPRPKLTAGQAIEIAQKSFKSDPLKLLLVAVDWYKSSEFQPRFSDGTQWQPVNDHPNDFSWFVTFAYKDPEIAKWLEKHPDGPTREFTSSTIVRVKDDGTIGEMVGVRTAPVPESPSSHGGGATP
jgi:hypothetical protein